MPSSTRCTHSSTHAFGRRSDMAIDRNFGLGESGLRPEEALSPTIEFEGAAPLEDAPLIDGRRRRRFGGYIAFAWMAFVLFIAIFHSVLPLAPYDEIIGPPTQPACFCLEEPLGTDAIGRSVTS